MYQKSMLLKKKTFEHLQTSIVAALLVFLGVIKLIGSRVDYILFC